MLFEMHGHLGILTDPSQSVGRVTEGIERIKDVRHFHDKTLVYKKAVYQLAQQPVF